MTHMYHSGSLGDRAHRDTLMKIIDYRLLSLHEHYLQTARNYIRQVRLVRDTKDITLLLDSGAFTAWKRKEPDIAVADLAKSFRGVMKLQKEFKDIFFISLDVIPGQPGTTPTHEEIKEAIRKSDENHHVLASEFGDRVLPVFHQGEPEERLQEVVALNPTYICVSPRNDVVEAQRRTWSQRVHERIPKETKTHGLATTGGKMMVEVPWYSVDSAALIQAAAFGKIFFPVGNDLRLLCVSDLSPNRRHLGKHAETFGPIVRKKIEAYMDKYKLTWQDLATNGGAREIINAIVLVEAAERKHKDTPVQETLFAL